MSTKTEEVETVPVELVQGSLFDNEHIKVKSDGIHFAETTPYEIWHDATIGILDMTRKSMRLAGQCLIFGERKYSDSYAQVLDPMKYSQKTLANAVGVVSALEDRWHDELSFDHHATVAPLKPEAQTELLDEAVKENLTTSALRKRKRERYPDKKRKTRDSAEKNAKGFPTLTAPKDEDKALALADILVAYFEQSEAICPAREWTKDRLKGWETRLNAIRKFHRRTGLQK
jgi:hypothetical protein